MPVTAGKEVAMKFQLAVVMPVYNEEACIQEVVSSWCQELAGLDIDFVMLVLNDGSRDDTGKRLEAFAGNRRVRVITKENSGHGSTILQGYRLGVDLATWVFQTDSDDEMKPDHFRELWNRREDYDALFGFRQGREQSFGRLLISTVSRQTVGLFFGKGIVDVNTPYRLMRGEVLRDIVAGIPDDTFAPNIVISGWLVKRGYRVCNHPVPHLGRRTGIVSIVKWKLWKAAARSFFQTLKLRG